MRISLSRKLLIVYGLLLSFSLVQGILLFSAVNQFREYNRDSELVKEFKFHVHELEKLNRQNLYSTARSHETFEEEYQRTKLLLARMVALNHSPISRFAPRLREAESFLDNYRRAYFEQDALVHSNYDLHARSIAIFSALRDRLSSLDRRLVEKLFLVLFDRYSIEENAFHNQDFTLLPQVKTLSREVAAMTADQSVTGSLQEIIQLIEANYINSLAIIDHQDFLDDTAAHLTGFSDEVVAQLTGNIDRYQAQLKWFMTLLVAAALLLTLFLFAISRRYFKKFLTSQQAAIRAIEQGQFTYSLPDLPQDELGDLALFLKDMAGRLQISNEEIRRSEENVRLLLNSTAEAIYGLDSEGRCTFCNNSFLMLMGYDREEELLGKNIHALIHHTRIDGTEYPQEACVAHRGFLEGKPTHSDSEVFWRRDGSSFYSECWSHPIIKNGKVTGAVVTSIDITKRRAAEQSLRNSEELYRTLVENIDLGITLIDRNHTIIMANAAHGRLLGRDPLRFKGNKCFREFEKREEICSHCPGIKAMETGKPGEVMTMGVRDDGTTFSVRIKAFPVFRDNKEIYGFIEVVEDVTERLRIEHDLAAEKERLAVTLRSIGDGVITTDIEGRVVLVNKVAERLCGWKQEEAISRPLPEIFRIVNELTGEPCENPVQKVLATGQIVALANHTVLIARDGTRRSIADSGAAIRDQESRIIGVVLVFRDVTEENIREKEFLKAQKLESIGILAGGIAHDFNNILSAVLGNINLVRHILKPDESKAQLYLEEAEKASVRAQNLTHQLLTFSKGGEPLKQAASVTDIIRDSTTFILRGTDIRYEFDFPEDLWPVDADPGQIGQVVQNLVINARHAMPDGGTLQISCCNIPPEKEKPLTLLQDRRYVLISIADNGIGIPEKVIDNIFDPYFTTKKEGSGLGLSVCHSIISKHHGNISVQSEVGTGTVFTFYLPASDEIVSDKEPEHHEQVFARKGISVLVMDDDEQIRTIAEAMLAHLGCATIQAEGGEKAIELYKASMEEGGPIDLVIMDLTIPGGMGGKEAVTEILKLDPDARVIVSSGYSNDPIMARHSEHGFCAAIVKPYQLKELAGAIDKALRK